jgi:hypothetical protein
MRSGYSPAGAMLAVAASCEVQWGQRIAFGEIADAQ